MQVVIRADASTAIGGGHVMRCLRLAKAFRAKGGEVNFLCRSYPGDLRALISQAGFAVDTVPVGDEEKDALHCQKVLKNAEVDVLILDHYALGEQWEKALKATCKKLLVIDDLANRKHDCDFLLDQNIITTGANPYMDLVPERCDCLLGPRFALLDPVFAVEARAVSPRKTCQNILLFFGSGDPCNHTAKVVREIMGMGLSVDVVIGHANPYREMLAALCQASGMKLHVQTPHMMKIMAKADLLLGAGGSTHWERCCLALPGLICAVADNQIALSCALAQAGTCRYLGDIADVPEGQWRETLQELMAVPELLHEMSLASKRMLPDARGVARVAESVTGKL